MRILIKSREEIEVMSQTSFPAQTALISITDAGLEFADLLCKPKFLLQIAFDDVDNDIFIDELGRRPTEEEMCTLETKFKMLTDIQAVQIATFYDKHRDEISTLICPCEHGQSRSAAVAAAILEFRSRCGISVFSHDKYYPNKVFFERYWRHFKIIVHCLRRTQKTNMRSFFV